MWGVRYSVILNSVNIVVICDLCHFSKDFGGMDLQISVFCLFVLPF